MATLNQELERHLAPVYEGMRVLNAARSVPEVVAALSLLEPVLNTAERVASRVEHVDTIEAREFRGLVASARRDLAARRRGVGNTPVTPEGVALVNKLRAKLNPQPPTDALILSREDIRDVRNYERAKARAKAEGKELWVE